MARSHCLNDQSPRPSQTRAFALYRFCHKSNNLLSAGRDSTDKVRAHRWGTGGHGTRRQDHVPQSSTVTHSSRGLGGRGPSRWEAAGYPGLGRGQLFWFFRFFVKCRVAVPFSLRVKGSKGLFTG